MSDSLKRRFVVSPPLGVLLQPKPPSEAERRQAAALAAQAEDREVERIARLAFGIEPDDPAYQPVRPITATDARHAIRLALRSGRSAARS